MKMVLAIAFGFMVPLQAASNDAGSWDRNGAAAYLDQRAAWWVTWKPAARDHDTFCISCHTALPYALGRPALRAALGESGPSVNEQKLLDNVRSACGYGQEVRNLSITTPRAAFRSPPKRAVPKRCSTH